MVVVQDALVVDVGVHVVGVGVFTAEGEVAFPQGAADDELGGVEGVLVLVVAGDALLLRGFAGGDVPLVHVLQGLAVRPEAVGVEVDVPVARLPVVIDVEGVAGGGHLLPSARGVLLVERVVLEHIRLHGVDVQFVLRRPVVVVTDADGVAFVELVVERQHGGEVHAGIIRAEVALLPPRLVEESLGDERLVALAIGSRAEHHAAQVEAALAVVEVELVEHVHLVIVADEEAVVEAEAFALRPLGVDAHHGLHRGIVARAGIAHHLHALDVVALQLVQLRGVAHFTSVDVDFRLARAEYVHRPLVCRHAGQFVQQVIARARCPARW